MRPDAIWAVVPFKGFERSKQRLSPAFRPVPSLIFRVWARQKAIDISGSNQSGFSPSGMPYMGVGVMKSVAQRPWYPIASQNWTISTISSGLAKPGGTNTPSLAFGNSVSIFM